MEPKKYEMSQQNLLPSLLLVYNPDVISFFQGCKEVFSYPTVFWWDLRGCGLMKGCLTTMVPGWPYWGGIGGVPLRLPWFWTTFDSSFFFGPWAVLTRTSFAGRWGIPLTGPSPSILQLLHAPGDSKRATRRIWRKRSTEEGKKGWRRRLFRFQENSHISHQWKKGIIILKQIVFGNYVSYLL